MSQGLRSELCQAEAAAEMGLPLAVTAEDACSKEYDSSWSIEGGPEALPALTSHLPERTQTAALLTVSV